MFQRTKIFNGLEYLYLVRNERKGKTIRQKVVRYLGPVEPVYKKTKIKTRKSNSWLFVKKLSESDKKELQKYLSSNSAFTRDRARIILFSNDGNSCKNITKNIECDQRKIREAIKSFNKKGISALQRGKAKGAAPKFTQEIKKIILMHFSKPPREFNYHFTTWTLPRFRKHLVEYKVVESIGIETLRQILMKAGAKLKRSKRWQYSPDKEFHKKNLQ